MEHCTINLTAFAWPKVPDVHCAQKVSFRKWKRHQPGAYFIIWMKMVCSGHDGAYDEVHTFHIFRALFVNN